MGNQCCEQVQIPQPDPNPVEPMKPNLKNRDEWNRLKEVQIEQKKMAKLIGLIKGQTQSGESLLSTGILVTANLVITSADAVFDRLQHKFHKNIRFYSSLNGEFKEDKGYHVQEVIVHESYTKPFDFQKYNLALIKLQKIVPNATTIVTFQHIQGHTFRAFVYGYPKLDYQNGLEDPNPHFYQIGGLGDMLIEEEYCSYQMESESGFSGCPIFTYVMNENKVKIIGIHLGKGKEQGWAKGLLFRKQLLDRLIQWQYDLTGITNLELSSNYLRNEKASLIRSGQKITEIQGVRMSQFK